MLFEEDKLVDETGEALVFSPKGFIDQVMPNFSGLGNPTRLAEFPDYYGVLKNSDLDPEKKYRLDSMKLVGMDSELSLKNMNWQASDMPFKARIHEEYLPITYCREWVFSMFNHEYSERLLTDSGDSTTIIFLLNLACVDDVVLTFFEQNDFDSEEPIEVSLKDWLIPIKATCEGVSDRTPDYPVDCKNIMVFDYYEPDNWNANTKDVIKMFFDFVYTETEVKNSGLLKSSFLMLTYRYNLSNE